MSRRRLPGADLATLIERTFGPSVDDAGWASMTASQRSAAVAALVPAVAQSARRAGVGAIAAGRWLADEVAELAPRLSFRDARALRAQHPGLTDDEIARRLVGAAKRTTAAIGAAAGGLSAIEFTAPPLLLAAPVQVAAETLAVAAVELRLVAELHEVMGRPAAGGATDRAGAYLMAWVRRTAVSSAQTEGVTAVVSAAARKELRSHLLRRAGRGATTLAPFLAGAAAGAEINRRATRQLGEAVLADLQTMRGDTWFRPL